MISLRARYDTIVVGAGPGGLCTAYGLGKLGVSVLLVERKIFPRSKVCGDSLTPRALRALDGFGLLPVAADGLRIRGLYFTDGERARIVAYDSEPPPIRHGLTIRRSLFDARLLDAAHTAGVDVIEGAEVKELRTDTHGRVIGVALDREHERSVVEARVVVVADGAHGAVSKRAQAAAATGAHDVIVTARQYVGGVVNFGSNVECYLPLRDGVRANVGFAWLVPLPDGIVNVGLGLVRKPRRRGPSAADVLRAFSSRLYERDPRFARAHPVTAEEGASLRIGLVDPFATPPGALVVGDAAGLINPYIGDGIAYALESAMLAVRTISQGFARDGVPTFPYARALRRSYPRHWRMRHGPRHFSQLCAGAIYEVPPDAGALARALWDFVFDRRDVGRTSPDLLDALVPASRRRILRGLLDRVARRIAERIATIDPMLSQLTVELLHLRPAATRLPVSIAALLQGRGATRRPILEDGLLALTLLLLGQETLSEVRGDGSAEAYDRLAILLGDVLLTEGAGAMAALPNTLYETIARTVHRASAARVRTAPAVPPGPERWRTAGATAGAAAALTEHALARSTAAEEASVAAATWLGETWAALTDARAASPDALAFLQHQTAIREQTSTEHSTPLLGVRNRLLAIVRAELHDTDTRMAESL